MLHQAGRISGSTDAIQLGARSSWATRLGQLKAELDALQQEVANEVVGETSLQSVRAFIRARRARSGLFGKSFFSDPAWDILLELYAVKLAQRRVSMSDICRAAEVPLATGVRWLGELETQGHVKRSADHLDARRIWVQLTPAGADRMSEFFRSLA